MPIFDQLTHIVYILDAYNIAHYLGWDTSNKTDFLRLLKPLARQYDIFVVFDGQSFSIHEQQNIHFIYTDQSESADTWIISYVKNKKNRCIVVSDDKEIIQLTRHNAYQIYSVSDFISRLPCVKNKRPNKYTSDIWNNHYTSIFEKRLTDMSNDDDNL